MDLKRATEDAYERFEAAFHAAAETEDAGLWAAANRAFDEFLALYWAR